MKKLSGIVLALVGLLVAAAGVVGFVLIGSDNVVNSTATTLKVGDAKAVISTPGLLAYDNTTLHVAAENASGPVFIGRAHPIDAKSFLAGAPTFAITKVDSSGTSGEAVEGDAKAVVPDPTKQTFWTDTATGPGTQGLDLELDGSPTQYVIMPLGEAGDLTVSSGVRIAGAFPASIAAIVVGILALVAALLLLRRRPRREAQPAIHPTDHRSHADDGDGDDAAAGAGAGSRGGPSPHVTQRVVAGVALAVLVPSLAGCGLAPSKVDAWENSKITKPALTAAEAAAVMRDYDVRNNAAIAQSAKSYDTDVWTGIDDGLLLSADIYSTRLAQAKKDASANPVTTKVGQQVYSPGFAAYPMYSLLATTQTVTKGKPSDVLVAMARTKVSAPWVKVAGVRVAADQLPPANEPGSASTLTAADEKAAVAAMGTLQKALNAGQGATLPKQITDHLADLRKKQEGIASSTVVASPWVPGDSGQVSPSGSIQAAKTAEGQVALISYQLLWTRDAVDNALISFSDANHAKAVGRTGDYPTLSIREALTLAVTIDAQGSPKVIGHTFHMLT